MRPREKLLSFILIVSIALLIYLAATLEPIGTRNTETLTDSERGAIKTEKIDYGLMVNNYRAATRQLVYDYEKILNEEEIYVDQILDLEQRLLDQVVPAEYKNLHINLLTALIRAEDSVKQPGHGEGEAPGTTLKRIKDKYSWLKPKL